MKNQLRKNFQKETNIAPVFANRSPYIEYINFLENKIDELTSQCFKEYKRGFTDGQINQSNFENSRLELNN
jgi:hypothetical protein